MTIQELADYLKREFAKEIILQRSYPQLIDPGVLRGEVHPYYLSYLVTLGNELDVTAVTNCPVSNAGRRDALGRNGRNERLPDAIWLGRTDSEHLAFFEFEGCSSTEDLANKAQNLLEAYHDAEFKPLLLVLMYWMKSSTGRLSIEPALEVFRRGFRDAQGHSITPAACPAAIIKADIRRRDERYRHQSFLWLTTVGETR